MRSARPSSATRSTSALASSRIEGSIATTRRGVKAFGASFFAREWSGGSRLMSVRLLHSPSGNRLRYFSGISKPPSVP